MPKSYDPSRVNLLKQEADKRVSASVEDIRGAISNWQNLPLQQQTHPKNGSNWPVPQFYLQPPSTIQGGSVNGEKIGGSSAGSLNSVRITGKIEHKNESDGHDLGHRGELNLSEKYNYDLSKAQLKASSRTSALLSGFAMVCLVELQYAPGTPPYLLITLGVVTSLLVSVHLLALMMSTCILPYMEATGCTQDSPHIKLKFYIDLSWLFSTCIGLLLFLVEIALIFWMKFRDTKNEYITIVTTAILVPVGVVFVVFSYLIHKSRVSHSLGRFKDKVDTMKQFLDVEASLPKSVIASTIHDV
ncbi:unnamed protein product [Caenorhabditis angaria]|uniref:Protein orai n=1 Tax=Caenorhabditis angaria TaxID=860376 RepID=A0A9P1IHU3_9PELO|nr:unnamed protein product [Caenorhabditis angaria]